MPRFKLVLGLVVIAGAVLVFALVRQSRQPGDPQRKAAEARRPGDAIAVREKKPSASPSGSHAVLKDLVKLPGESDRADSNAPRMQSKQIKMH
jgi:hypothetical protein